VGQFVFSQLLAFLRRRKLNDYVGKFRGTGNLTEPQRRFLRGTRIVPNSVGMSSVQNPSNSVDLIEPGAYIRHG
jgi:hypothetical protein